MERAERIDLRMHRDLAASMRHIQEASRGRIDFDVSRLDRLIDRLDDGEKFPPAVFADYFDLVEEIDAGFIDQARVRFESLANAAPAEAGLAIMPLREESMGDLSERYARMMNDEPDLDISFIEPQRDEAAAFSQRLDQGLALLDQAIPELAGEFRAIIRQIVICGSDPAKQFQFDGGSHSRLWGALFLNARFHPDAVAVAEVLAHESAHSLLFGFCIDEGLVRNDGSQRFASPLRTDLRPMEGIYHATFVSARMHWAMSRLEACDSLDGDVRRRAGDAARADRDNFFAGAGVIEAHGDLTATGAALMAGARDYMDQQR